MNIDFTNKQEKQLYNNLFDAGVYALWDNDKIIYIGKTEVGLVRIYTGHNDKQFTHFSFIPITIKDLDKIEKYLIQKHKPIFNKQYIKVKKQISKKKKLSNGTIVDGKETLYFNKSGYLWEKF